MKPLLSGPQSSGHPLLSGHLERSRGCPLNRGFIVVVRLALECGVGGGGGVLPEHRLRKTKGKKNDNNTNAKQDKTYNTSETIEDNEYRYTKNSPRGWRKAG